MKSISVFQIVVFLDGENFCKAFAGAKVHLSHIPSGEVETVLLNQIIAIAIQ